MDTSLYNDYVLSASVQAGWISEDQKQVIESALARLPGVAALDFMYDQAMLEQSQVDMLQGLIAQAQNPAPATAVPEPAPMHSVELRPPNPGSGGHSKVLDYLAYAVSVGASDLHLGPDSPPLLRYNGALMPISPDAAELTPEECETLARQFLRPEQVKMVEETGGVDFCYQAPDQARFRTSVVRQRRGWESVFRVIQARVRSMQELGLPPVLYELVKYHNGLILVTGPVGSGKTTTLASMVQQINIERHDHIITLEDPVEYVFKPEGCQVTQREIHTHTESFSSALRAALRQDPDVVMVGEMRDLETISLAITASETGHLVLATLHTSNAPRTMQRLLDVFPVDQQAQIRTMVSESLRGVICQQLVPRADGKGRALALEIMTNNPAIGNLIREGNNFMLPGQIQIGRRAGMQLMDDALLELVEKSIITPDDAFERCEDRKAFAQELAGRMKKR
ncbi:MAG: PilT/PilU family type 4a pilus ATPase [Methylacidiphilales bacterium]|nr:PilT/PilU family type 4a pilus ATPase [Candidatus Methylacidiphilales bacterium]